MLKLMILPTQTAKYSSNALVEQLSLGPCNWASWYGQCFLWYKLLLCFKLSSCFLAQFFINLLHVHITKSRAPNLHFSLKTKPEHPKYDRIFMPSRRPKVMILIWKDRYLSHDPRRSGKRSFGSLVGPELIFYQDMSDERLSRAHGDFDGSRGPRYRAQGLGSS
ncbi:unnamed protein product [Microthlaspi erraticum]|uniref:Uncharacterized protein n=1 Tax=Microthlaspi erraticum TaxID=1685480 RepID=A0A6D2IJD9_9BRAS|nr:unnamed protein product [Microthlaspi erraticum]